MKIIISTDSTADLSTNLYESRKINIVPLHVILGGQEYSDGIDINPEMIYQYVEANKILPKTSAVAVGEYYKNFENALKDADYLIHFNISSECSSTIQNAKLAAEQFDGKVKIIDSRHLSTGQGLLVLKACDLRDEGKDVDEIVRIIEETKKKVQTSFVIDTLDYLAKGGRCSSLSLIASKLFKIHPRINMPDGQLIVGKKHFGSLFNCINTYVDDIISEYPNYDETRVFVTHTNCSPTIVEAVKNKLKEKCHFQVIEETIAGSVVTSHCGKGTLGVLFITK
jgi:DegV family protein with EDD domain